MADQQAPWPGPAGTPRAARPDRAVARARNRPLRSRASAPRLAVTSAAARTRPRPPAHTRRRAGPRLQPPVAARPGSPEAQSRPEPEPRNGRARRRQARNAGAPAAGGGGAGEVDLAATVAGLACAGRAAGGRVAAGAGRSRQPPQAHGRDAARRRRRNGRGWRRSGCRCVDNLELALRARREADGAIVEGVRAVRDQAIAVLARLGFPRRDDSGREVRSGRHEAVAAVPDPDAPAGDIVPRAAAGLWRWRAPLRPAAVVVATPPAPPRIGLMAGARDFYEVAGGSQDGQPGRDPAGLPQARPRSITPTSTRTRRPRSGSRRSRRPTTCCPIPTRAGGTTRSAPISAGCPRAWIAETWRARAGGGAGARRGRARARRAGRAAGRCPGVWFSSGTGDDVDFDDLLGGLFSGRGRRGWGGPVPGADQEAEVELTVEEAHRGGRRTITLSGPDGPRTLDRQHPGRGHRGSADTAGRPGRPGQRRRPARRPLPGGADRAPPQVPASNGVTSTSICRSPRGRRRSARPCAIDTPGGEAKVKVPRGTSSGRRLRLRGRGLPNPKGKPAT